MHGSHKVHANLRPLYAQSFRITLAPPVLPRLLARNEPGLFVRNMSCSSACTNRFTTENGLRPSREMAGSGLRPLSKILHCCLMNKFGPCLSPNVADRPLRPAKDHRLGALLPHQLPNPTQAHQRADALSFAPLLIPFSYALPSFLSL